MMADKLVPKRDDPRNKEKLKELWNKSPLGKCWENIIFTAFMLEDYDNQKRGANFDLTPQ